MAVAGRQFPADAQTMEVDMAARKMPRLKNTRRARRIRPHEFAVGLSEIVCRSAIGGVAVSATALSLSDLADNIQDVAQVATSEAYALATPLDANFIAPESFSLFATAAVARTTGKATMATKVITLTMSGVANAYAMASHAGGR